MPQKKSASSKTAVKREKPTVAKKTAAGKKALKTGAISRPGGKPAVKTAGKSVAKTVTKKAPAKKTPAKKPTSPAAKKTGKVAAKKPVVKAATKTVAQPAKPVAKKMTPGIPNKDGLALVKKCVRALDDKKAESLRVIFVGEKSSVTDFFVVATGNSEPHLRALRIAVEKELDDEKALIVGKESQPESGWCVVDAFDVIVHLLLPGQRENYQLESLWKDGEDLPVAELLK